MKKFPFILYILFSIGILMPHHCWAQVSFKDRAINRLNSEFALFKRSVKAAQKSAKRGLLSMQEREDLRSIGKRVGAILGTIAIIVAATIVGQVAYKKLKKPGLPPADVPGSPIVYKKVPEADIAKERRESQQAEVKKQRAFIFKQAPEVLAPAIVEIGEMQQPVHPIITKEKRTLPTVPQKSTVSRLEHEVQQPPVTGVVGAFQSPIVQQKIEQMRQKEPEPASPLTRSWLEGEYEPTPEELAQERLQREALARAKAEQEKAAQRQQEQEVQGSQEEEVESQQLSGSAMEKITRRRKAMGDSDIGNSN